MATKKSENKEYIDSLNKLAPFSMKITNPKGDIIHDGRKLAQEKFKKDE